MKLSVPANSEPEQAMPGLNMPRMNDGNQVTGANKEKHRVENKRRRIDKQVEQG